MIGYEKKVGKHIVKYDLFDRKYELIHIGVSVFSFLIMICSAVIIYSNNTLFTGSIEKIMEANMSGCMYEATINYKGSQKFIVQSSAFPCLSVGQNALFSIYSKKFILYNESTNNTADTFLICLLSCSLCIFINCVFVGVFVDDLQKNLEKTLTIVCKVSPDLEDEKSGVSDSSKIMIKNEDVKPIQSTGRESESVYLPDFNPSSDLITPSLSLRFRMPQT